MYAGIAVQMYVSKKESRYKGISVCVCIRVGLCRYIDTSCNEMFLSTKVCDLIYI